MSSCLLVFLSSCPYIDPVIDHVPHTDLDLALDIVLDTDYDIQSFLLLLNLK